MSAIISASFALLAIALHARRDALEAEQELEGGQ